MSPNWLNILRDLNIVHSFFHWLIHSNLYDHIMLSYTMYLQDKGDQLSWYVMSQVSPDHDHCDKETLDRLYFLKFQSFRPLATIHQYTYLCMIWIITVPDQLSKNVKNVNVYILRHVIGFLTVAGLAQSVERVHCKAGCRGFNSRGRTNTQGLKITEKWRYSLCTATG